jgi:choline kinase
MRESSGTSVPKQLCSIWGRPLIQRVMEQFYEAGIERFVVVLGWERQYLAKKISGLYIPGTKLLFAENDQWDTHGTGISLQKAQGLLKNDREFICCMGDHLFEPEIIEKMLACRRREDVYCEAYMAIDYREDQPRETWSTKVQMSPQHQAYPEVRAIGRDLSVYQAQDAGLFIFPKLVFKSILQVQGEQGDVDLCEGVQRHAENVGVRVVNVAPWEWANINDAESIKQIDPRLIRS